MTSKLLSLALLFGLCGCGSKPKDIYVGSKPVQLYIVNQSKYPNDKVQKMVAGLNAQLAEEFKSIWIVDANISFQDPPDNSYRTVILLDNFSRWPNTWHKALGFHTTGTLAYVDVEECGSDDVISLASSHEVLEMLVNPNVEPTGYEVCDPVYLLRYAYKKGDVTVSDFVYPNFYNPLAPGPYDHTGYVKAPLEPAPGGVLFATLQAMLKLAEWHRGIIR